MSVFRFFPRPLLRSALSLALLSACSLPGEAVPEPAGIVGHARIGATAPDFTLEDLAGNDVALSSLRGKPVVLEWFNPGCPFVGDTHAEDGILASYPGVARERGAHWIAINSGAPGKQGFGVEANRAAAEKWGIDYPILLDPTGEVGRLYDATSTPHMFVIDATGTLVYRGAIDNRPLGVGIGTATNFVDRALSAIAAGSSVATPSTRPYGCGNQIRRAGS